MITSDCVFLFSKLDDCLQVQYDRCKAVQESVNKISIYRVSWVLRAVFLAVTFTGFGAAAAQDASNVMAGEAGHGARGDSSVQVRPADF